MLSRRAGGHAADDRHSANVQRSWLRHRKSDDRRTGLRRTPKRSTTDRAGDDEFEVVWGMELSEGDSARGSVRTGPIPDLPAGSVHGGARELLQGVGRYRLLLGSEEDEQLVAVLHDDGRDVELQRDPLRPTSTGGCSAERRGR